VRCDPGQLELTGQHVTKEKTLNVLTDPIQSTKVNAPTEVLLLHLSASIKHQPTIPVVERSISARGTAAGRDNATVPGGPM
jgi:hypothetical protein